jgi:putative ABC transport system substrate-binding protein
MPCCAQHRRELPIDHWSRRQFVQGVGIVGLGLLAGCGQLPGPAKQAAPVYRIGYLSPNTTGTDTPRFESLRQGLRDLGWIEGQNIVFERHLADGQMQRLPSSSPRTAIR